VTVPVTPGADRRDGSLHLTPSVVCPVLIGRAAPLTTIADTLDRALDSRGGTLLVSGEAGVGKSRLVRDMVERARASGFVALQGAWINLARLSAVRTRLRCDTHGLGAG
jgi:MoxR-like ATPase